MSVYDGGKHTIKLTKSNEELVNNVKENLGVYGERSNTLAVTIIVNAILNRYGKDILAMFGGEGSSPRIETMSTPVIESSNNSYTDRLPPISF